MTADDILSKLHDKPFQPFRLKLSTNETLDVQNPNMVIVGETRTVLPTSVRKSDQGFEMAENFKSVANDHIVTFEDIAAPGSRRKRA